MRIGRFAPPETLFLLLSCAFRPVASDAAIAEPRNPRRLMDMNSPCSGNGEKDNTARQRRAGRPRPAEPFDSAQGRLGRLPLIHHLQHASDAFAKNGRLGDQTQHEMSLVWKIAEVARMHDDTDSPQEIDGQIFVSSKYGDTEDNVPSALDQQSSAGGMFCKLAIEFRKIHAQTIAKNGLDLLALTEQHRSGKLHRSIHGEKGVADDFQARSCFSDLFFRAAGGHPGKLHLRERRNLGHSAESEGERVCVADETATWRAIMRIIQKNFVHNQSQIAVTAESVERRGFRSRDVGAGWIIGMDENHGSRPDGGRVVERIEIDLPSVIVEQ